jgi:hypothetical protein
MANTVDGIKRLRIALLLTALSNPGLRKKALDHITRWCKELGIPNEQLLRMDSRTASKKLREFIEGQFDENESIQ